MESSRDIDRYEGKVTASPKASIVPRSTHLHYLSHKLLILLRLEVEWRMSGKRTQPGDVNIREVSLNMPTLARIMRFSSRRPSGVMQSRGTRA